MNKFNRYYLHNNGEYVNYWKNYLNKNDISDKKMEIYIDYPFCRSKCKFCVYSSNIIHKYQDINIYENAVLTLLHDMKDIIPKNISSIYFGGGTPSLSSKEFLISVKNNILNYDNIKNKSFEYHPYDFNEDYISFLINEMKINFISLGVQSFHKDSIISQNRIYVEKEKIIEIVNFIKNKNCYVNIDLICLLNDYNIYGYEIFKNDLYTTIHEVIPDKITVSPNFLVKDYVNSSLIMRRICNELLEDSDYINYNNSLLIKDIKEYGSAPYYIPHKNYKEYMKDEYVMEIDNKLCDVEMNIIAFGGSEKHPANSINNESVIYSYFDEYSKNILHLVTDKTNPRKVF